MDDKKALRGPHHYHRAWTDSETSAQREIRKLYSSLLQRLSKLSKPAVAPHRPPRDPWPPTSKNFAVPPLRRNKASDLRTQKSLQPPPGGELDLLAAHKEICHRGFRNRQFPPGVGALPPRAERSPQKITLPSPASPTDSPPRAALKRPPIFPPKPIQRERVPEKLIRQAGGQSSSPGSPPPGGAGQQSQSPLPRIFNLFDNNATCDIQDENSQTSWAQEVGKLLWETIVEVFSLKGTSYVPKTLVILSFMMIGVSKMKDLKQGVKTAPSKS